MILFSTGGKQTEIKKKTKRLSQSKLEREKKKITYTDQGGGYNLYKKKSKLEREKKNYIYTTRQGGVVIIHIKRRPI